jgi:hypothetical protein
VTRITDLLSTLYTQSVTVEPWESQDSAGEPVFGTAVTHKARVVDRRRLTRTIAGQEVMSTTTVWIMGHPVIDARSRITLPTEYGITSSDDRTPRILDVHRYPDLQGPVYTMVLT